MRATVFYPNQNCRCCGKPLTIRMSSKSYRHPEAPCQRCHVLSRTPITVASPFTALTFALVYLAGALLFGEPVTIRAIAGVILILGRLFLITAP